MKHYAKPTTPLAQPPAPERLPDVSNVSIRALLNGGLLALQREMRNLLTSSAHGKLDKDDARDLRESVKLLVELKSLETKSLKDMTDEELDEELATLGYVKVKKDDDNK